MDRHTQLFFGDDDVARFIGGRISFLDEPLVPDDAFKLPLSASPLQYVPVGIALGSTRILPTADECRRVREQEERREQERSTTGGELCVNVDSLPFVHDETGAGKAGLSDEKKSLQQDSGRKIYPARCIAKKNTRGNVRRRENSIKGGWSPDNERVSQSDALIATFDEDETSDREGLTLLGRSKKMKLSHADRIDQTPAPVEKVGASFSWRNKKTDAQLMHNSKTHMAFSGERKNSNDLYSEQWESEEDGGDSSEDSMSDDSISSHDDVDACGLKGNGSHIRELKSISNKKNGEQPESRVDAGEASEDNSDELISSDDDDDECDLKATGLNNRQPKAAPSSAAATLDITKTLTTSSEAIGSSIVKLTPGDSQWHGRRSESEVVLSRIKHKNQRSLLKRPRGRRQTANPANAIRQKMGVLEAAPPRRTTLRFAAAPSAVNNRKKQTSLKSMFKKANESNC